MALSQGQAVLEVRLLSGLTRQCTVEAGVPTGRTVPLLLVAVQPVFSVLAERGRELQPVLLGRDLVMLGRQVRLELPQ